MYLFKPKWHLNSRDQFCGCGHVLFTYITKGFLGFKETDITVIISNIAVVTVLY